MNFPNKLTMLRIVMIPLFIACFYLPFAGWNYLAAALFVLAYFTDILDGRYARKHNLITDFGKLMDPIADKLLTVSALVMILYWGRISPLVVIVIVSRELFISGFRLVAASKGNVIAASWQGKVKTISQFVAISWILLGNPLFGAIGIPMDQILSYVSAGFTLWSGVDYILKNKGIVEDR